MALLHVMAGADRAIPIEKSAALYRSAITGTGPVMTWTVVLSRERSKRQQ
ncbi:hypothetical protein ACD578_02745 [Microvirga sp. RSM25]|jgi:hypothetical protein